MEENVALDSNKQKQFMKSLKGLKRLMKKSGPKAGKLKAEKKDEVQKEEKRKEEKISQEKVVKKKRKPKGLVYLSHIPHGFYENEMSQYFKQFGVVTNVRVIRSKRTGRSKGHAFVEFKNTDVAQVVAETMNNYLMGKRLIKAVYIPPKDQRRNVRRKNWNDQHNPGSEKKLLMKKGYNSIKSQDDDLKIARKLLSNLSNTKSKLKELSIDYEFFNPVDVPEALLSTSFVKEEKSEENITPSEKKGKGKDEPTNAVNINNDKKNASVTISNEVQSKEEDNKKSKKKNKKQKKKSEVTTDNAAPNKDIITYTNVAKQTGKNANKNNKLASTPKPVIEQGQKQKSKNAAVKPPEEFIKLGADGNEDSDSSYHFDSDEFDNIMNSDDSDNSDNEVTPIQKVNNKNSKDLPPKKNNEGQKVAAQNVQVNRQNIRQQQQNKRKPPPTEKAAGQSKKPKFEKQSKKKLPNKQIKKKK